MSVFDAHIALIISLERENQRQHENHHQTHDDLQRQANFHIVHKDVFAGRHHERVGRRGERRSEAHAGGNGNREEERRWVDADLLRTVQRNGGKQYGSRRIAYEHRHERRSEVNAGHKRHWSELSETVDQRSGDERRSTSFLQRLHYGPSSSTSPLNRMRATGHLHWQSFRWCPIG